MKVMVMVKATADSEAGRMPSPELFAAMDRFNEELVNAGVMESGDGLKPTSEGYRVRFSGSERSVTKGPFIETNELLAGYWIWNVSSMEEALEWVKKCPNPMEEDSDIEVRTFYEMDDFAELDPSGELRAKEDELRRRIAMQKATINTYVFFNGRCEEALEYYREHLGAEVDCMIRYSDSPEPAPEGMLPDGFENKVMHSQFKVANAEIFASDGCEPDKKAEGFSLALTLPSKEEAGRIFNALADGGTVNMPLSESFWSPLYGQVTDKFGIGWMVMLPGNDQAPGGK
jgi:PhnB protein